MAVSQLVDFFEQYRCRIMPGRMGMMHSLEYIVHVHEHGTADVHISEITHADGTINWIEVDVITENATHSFSIYKTIE